MNIMHKKNTITVALAGQPNCGKSTMFNMLTGSTARVGNYPGITVNRMEGYCKTENYKIKFIDLPGTYSLTSYSLEEVVARDVILHERPDIVVCMLDSSALERSLYLVIQIIEIGVPIIIGLNMMDEVKRDGIQINSARLSEKLNVPVIECVARRGIGKEEILKAIVRLYENEDKWEPNFNISYGMDIDLALDGMENLIAENKFVTDRYPARWLAIKYIEGDTHIIGEGRKFSDLSEKLESTVRAVEIHIEKSLKTYPEAIIADYRYGFIASLLKEGIIHRTDAFRRNFSETIDKVLTQRFLGPLAMIGVLYLLFWVTFTAGSYPQEWLQDCFGYIGGLGNKYITNELLRSLVVSGIIDGVGAVLSFAPLILIMFAMLCFLEDLGYMARVAYMLDKIFRTFGLHGASVMPFIIAGGIPGGCAVPGVMAARTLKSPKERIATILTAPFMVCGAKTTVYLMFAGAFFPHNETIVMLALTIGSWIFALLVSYILRKTILRGRATPFIMELPPYRLPTVYGIATHTLDRIWQFVKKAGTVIFAVSIVMWCLMTFPRLPENLPDSVLVTQIVSNKVSVFSQQNNDQLEALKYSFAGRLGMVFENVTQYAGFQWQTNIALIGGFAAKEVILSTLSTAYSLGSYSQEDAKQNSFNLLKQKLLADPNWNLPAILSVFLFMLLYAPCLTAVFAIARETSWTWAIGGTAGSLVLAYVLSVIVYQFSGYLLN
jgi:ferrous iron transport protein B